ncbi:MAG: hypothetical protein RLZZ491_1582 [Pseudomonadota bacterium]|jgi:uncharacterized protein (DUF427 family)
MAEHIKIRKAPGTWVVRAGGAVLGESNRALELTEGSYPPVIYFPRDDIGMAFLESTDSSTRCPHKGVARYFTLCLPTGDMPDSAWSYEAPLAPMAAIAGHIAFYTDRVTVERV